MRQGREHRPGVVVAGVDGARGGWMVATVRVVDHPAGSRAEVLGIGMVARFDDVLAGAIGGVPTVVAVDMPIGLPSTGPRAADIEARRLLRPCGSRVFPAPPRVTLSARSDYRLACELARSATGRAIPLQTWHLLGKIAEVDDCLTGLNGLGGPADDVVVEVHPELSFAAMVGGVIREPKRARLGRELRLMALASVLDGLDPGSVPRGDDAPDALACAWTAARIVRCEHRRIPAGQLPRDEAGRPMRIVT